ncbi:hypothetical protein ACFPOU_08275 [Massilia jejuensis]|uniref:Uncharacterized protein n=1 Tax=Massilia jejuensis TaxID=648894 RepID=A0ABW0PHF9_9BURK
MSIWESFRNTETMGLVDNGVAIGAAMRERKAIAQDERKFREGYATALANAKQTGVMPTEYQRTVPVDEMGRQIGVKVVALRELGKLNASHPLVASAQVRANIGTQTLVNYNKAERPDGVDLNDYAPSDTAAQKIYAFTLKG